MIWTDVCRKCNTKIFNEIPSGIDIVAYIAKKKEEGWTVGYKEKIVGSYGNTHEVKIKPICTNCSKKESDIKIAKETKKAIQKISKILKRQFSCPICEYDQRRGYNTKDFKCNDKKEMIEHIKEKHNIDDIKNILPNENIFGK